MAEDNFTRGVIGVLAGISFLYLWVCISFPKLKCCFSFVLNCKQILVLVFYSGRNLEEVRRSFFFFFFFCKNAVSSLYCL